MKKLLLCLLLVSCSKYNSIRRIEENIPKAEIALTPNEYIFIVRGEDGAIYYVEDHGSSYVKGEELNKIKLFEPQK